MTILRNARSLALLLAFCASLVLAQNNDRISIGVEGRAAVQVRAMVDNGILYFSLDDLVHELGLPAYINTVTQKIEVNAGKGQIYASGNSPFFEISSPGRTTESMVQLPVEIRFLDGKFFVPSTFFVPFFNSISSRQISIDTSNAEVITAAPTATAQWGITGLLFETRKNGIFVRIQTSREFRDFDRFVKDDWLYVTIPNAKANTEALNASLHSDAFSQIVLTQYPTAVQIALHSKMKMIATNIARDPNSTDLMLTIEASPDDILKTMKTGSADEKTGQQERVLAQLKKQRTKWKLDVVVLDPGHGGYDPGTIGVIGTREKDVTLGIGLKLGKLIEQQLPDVKVVYTRKTDRFIELYRRGQIANENGGKLFISIHANSLPMKPSPVNGFEIYLLRPGKTDDAIKIAEKENSVVRLEEDAQDRYQEITEENFIILTMAQSAYMKQSEHFAELLSDELSHKLSPQSRGVKQAGFYVLVGASMPNALVETGYLSNRNDEMFLRNPDGQQIIAESMLRSIQRYKRQYEETLKDEPVSAK